jgi:hypothetical protein
MIETEITVLGPTREWISEVDEFMEPTGDGHFVTALRFEALGSDRKIHIESLIMMDNAPSELVERAREMGCKSLEMSMRDEGVWPS